MGGQARSSVPTSSSSLFFASCTQGKAPERAFCAGAIEGPPRLASAACPEGDGMKRRHPTLADRDGHKPTLECVWAHRSTAGDIGGNVVPLGRSPCQRGMPERWASRANGATRWARGPPLPRTPPARYAGAGCDSMDPAPLLCSRSITRVRRERSVAPPPSTCAWRGWCRRY